MLITMALVFGIFYFLIIRPSQKREKDRQSMLGGIKPGDQVVTTGGLVGKVTGTSDKYIVMEISPRVRVRVYRANVAGKDEEPGTETAKPSKRSKGKKKDDDQDKAQKSSSEQSEAEDE